MTRSHGPVQLARIAAGVLVVGAVAFMAWGTWQDPDFWRTTSQRGDELMATHDYRSAAEVYVDPWRVGVAMYRNGDFEDAAHTFARVPGAVGAFNQGNAWLMHGRYDTAIESYDRALGFSPAWTEAEENRALAVARKKQLDDAGANREQESADAYEPDDVALDQKGKDQPLPPQDLSSNQLSDDALRATWLRRVQTTPGQFLRAKFAYQAAEADRTAPGGDPE